MNTCTPTYVAWLLWHELHALFNSARISMLPSLQNSQFTHFTAPGPSPTVSPSCWSVVDPIWDSLWSPQVKKNSKQLKHDCYEVAMKASWLVVPMPLFIGLV